MQYQLAAIVQSSDDAIIGKTDDGIITSWNLGAAKIYGYSAEEVEGASICILVPPERTDDELPKILEQLQRGEEIDHYETVHLCKDGSRIDVSLTISPIRNASGAVIGASTIARDITRRKQAEEGLRQSEERFRTLADACPVAIFRSDATGGAVYVNERWSEIAGLTPAESLGWGWMRALHPEDRERVLTDWCRALEAREPFESEYRIRATDGRTIWVLGRALPERNRDAEVVGYVGTLTDISERKATEERLRAYNEELEQTNRAKNEFLSVISHELRTPLNSITGYAELMKDGLFGEINAQQDRALGKILKRSYHLLDMIVSILYATSIEAGAVKVEDAEIDLAHFLHAFRSDYSAPLDTEVTLIWDLPPRLAVVRTDGEKLQHILQNLIHNAVKFTGKGTVKISAEVREETNHQGGARKLVQLKVADSGIGIPKEQLPVIFELFRQGNSSETRPFSGMGLGLYIVKRLTEMLHGSVEVESQPGQGSTFTVTIPF